MVLTMAISERRGQEMRDSAPAAFSKQPAKGQAIYEQTLREVAKQVAMHATRKATRAGGVTERGDANNINIRPTTPVTRLDGPPRAREQDRGAKSALTSRNAIVSEIGIQLDRDQHL